MFRKIASLCSLLTMLLALTLSGISGEAEARRLGGGKSFGMQRQAPPPSSAPSQAAATAPAAATAAAAAPKRSWLGPAAGLAAGLGLAALASHFGLGEEMASFMLMAVVGLVVLFLVRRLLGSRQPRNGMAFATTGRGHPTPAFAALPGGSTPSSHSIPAGFDAAGFVRQAKINFIRLQAAHDRGDLDDIREFTTPEFFAEVSMQYDERGRGVQQTDIVTLDSEVLDVVTEGTRHVVSVRFHGLLREGGPEDSAATPFDEIWHLVKPIDGGRGWAVAGIQQRQ